MMYGVIDIGSNTMRLSVYKVAGNSFSLMLTKKSMAGLAGYVDKKGHLSPRGVKRAVGVLTGFKQILQNIDVKEVFVFATASLRNIKNTDETLEKIHQKTGFHVDLVSGEREAQLDYIGAAHFLKLDQGVLIDIGGGSTELVFYADGKIEQALSIPIGSLSLYTKHVKDILPTEKELSKIKDSIKTELKKIDIAGNYPIICGVGGSIRCACKLCNEVYALPDDHRSIEIKALNKMLHQMHEDRKFAVQMILKAAPDRIHTILPGITILQMAAAKFGGENILVSEYGVREGYLCNKLFGGVSDAGTVD